MKRLRHNDPSQSSKPVRAGVAAVLALVVLLAGAGAASARGFGEFDLRDDFQDNKVPPGAEPEYNGGCLLYTSDAADD